MVWELVSDFREMRWNSRDCKIECEGDGVGMIRRMTFPWQNEPVVSRLDLDDQPGRCQRYTIVNGILAPVSDFTVCICVNEESDQSCCVDVEIRFEAAPDSNPDDVRYIFQHSYDEALDRLEAYLDGGGR